MKLQFVDNALRHITQDILSWAPDGSHGLCLQSRTLNCVCIQLMVLDCSQILSGSRDSRVIFWDIPTASSLHTEFIPRNVVRHPFLLFLNDSVG
jgi:hypothetical protein